MVSQIFLVLLTLGLLTALLFLGRLYFHQNRLIFRPGTLLQYTPADDALPFEDLSLPTGSGFSIRLWWIPHPGSNKVVIYFHGSDGNLTHENSTIRYLYSLPVSILAVEYPGYQRDRVKASEARCYLAAQAAWSYLVETKGYPPENLILYGQSLGGAVGVYLATERPCGGLVIQSSFTSVPDMGVRIFPYLPVRWFVHTKMNSLARISHIRCPLIILHSKTDKHIPIAQARQLYERANVTKLFVSFSAPHFSKIWQLVPEIRTGWRQLLAGDFSTWQQPSTEITYAGIHQTVRS
jgi:fermentation-respiration switch protein FrsA (DUF1100 family)